MNADRKARARAAAEQSAPRPVGSSLTYGFIGAVLAGLAMAIFATFYQASLTAIPVAILLAVGFVAGVVLRKVRRRRHVCAYKRAYGQAPEDPPKQQ